MSYDELLDAVKDYWSDTSRSAGQTKEDLLALIEEIEILIESLNDGEQ